MVIRRIAGNIDGARVVSFLSFNALNLQLNVNHFSAFRTEKPLFRSDHAGTASLAELHDRSLRGVSTRILCLLSSIPLSALC